MLHGASHCFKNSLHASTGNVNITIEGFTFDGDDTFDGGVSMVGVQGLIVRDCYFTEIKQTGITVGIGISSSASATSADIDVAGCIFDAPDYGVVVDSDPGTGAAINNVRISNNRFTINWGSAVSLAGAISGGVVSGNVIRLLGDLPDLALDTGVGIGVKIWDGADISNSNADISITGNAFIGPSSRTDIQGVSIANFSKRVVINGNTFFQMTKALLNNFAGSGVLGISFTSNVC
jgi:hypothetical protein